MNCLGNYWSRVQKKLRAPIKAEKMRVLRLVELEYQQNYSKLGITYHGTGKREFLNKWFHASEQEIEEKTIYYLKKIAESK